ncbi:hypothetical protein Tco_0516437 [Tanacetum coccineum]
MEPILNMIGLIRVLGLGAIVLVAIYAWRFLNWVWLKPKKMEKFLRDQGLKGTSYKFLYGDVKEMVKMITEAYKKPINLDDDIIPRVLLFAHSIVTTHDQNNNLQQGALGDAHNAISHHYYEIWGDVKLKEVLIQKDSHNIVECPMRDAMDKLVGGYKKVKLMMLLELLINCLSKVEDAKSTYITQVHLQHYKERFAFIKWGSHTLGNVGILDSHGLIETHIWCNTFGVLLNVGNHINLLPPMSQQKQAIQFYVYTEGQSKKLAGQAISFVSYLSVKSYSFKNVQNELEVIDVTEQNQMVGELDGLMIKNVQYAISSFLSFTDGNSSLQAMLKDPCGDCMVLRVLKSMKNVSSVMLRSRLMIYLGALMPSKWISFCIRQLFLTVALQKPSFSAEFSSVENVIQVFQTVSWKHALLWSLLTKYFAIKEQRERTLQHLKLMILKHMKTLFNEFCGILYAWTDVDHEGKFYALF